jgi:hypothetical protein
MFNFAFDNLPEHFYITMTKKIPEATTTFFVLRDHPSSICRGFPLFLGNMKERDGGGRGWFPMERRGKCSSPPCEYKLAWRSFSRGQFNKHNVQSEISG